MGNEASLEGGEGGLAGLPEGLAPDGKGGFIRIPSGVQADLSQLSEDDRKQIAAAMSRTQGRKPGGAPVRRPSESDAQQRPQQAGVGASRGPSGLSKSRTVDAFGQGPVGKPSPGRSPSSLSLLESKFRQEPKDPETRSGMFGSNFLSGANPLNAVSSMTSSVSSSMSSAVNIPKFGLFGDEEEDDSPPPTAAKAGGKPPGGAPVKGKGPQQGPGPKGPQQGGPPRQGQAGPPGQQGPKPGQGPPGPKGPQQGGPPRQGQAGPPGQGPKPGQGPPGQGPPGQQGPKPGQGPPGQQGPKPGQGPPGQGPSGQQGPKPGQGPPGQQGPKPGQGPPGQQGQKPGQGPPQQGGPPQQKGGPQGPPQGPGGKLGPQQGGPGGPGGPANVGGPPGPPGAGKPGGGVCPLCKSTQLNVGAKEPPNYSTCTECKNQVCSLCGFSPPDSQGKEWLCLNCQMQRAMGGMENSGPPSAMKPRQGSAPSSPQRKDPNAKADGRKPSLLIKQQSVTDSYKGLTPPTTPRGKSPGPSSPGPMSPGGQKPPDSPGSTGSRSQPPSPQHRPGGPPQIDPKTGRPIQPSQKGSPQPSPAKPKQESSFFGGLGGLSLGGLTDVAKPPAAASQAAESVTGKLFGGFGGFTESAKPQAPPSSGPKQEESVAGKLFGGFGFSESAKPPAATAQTAEAVSGKMFGFGSSILSSATNLISNAPGSEDANDESPPGSPPDTPGADSDPGSPPDSPFSPPGSPPDDSDCPPDTPDAKSKDAPKPTPLEEVKPAPEPPKADEPSTQAPGSGALENCPLCKVELNMGSDPVNYSICTECNKTVCNLCGFNPTPHLGEKEWLCLNCQTQRALSGQMGHMPPPSMASPTKEHPAAPLPTSPASPPPAPAPASPASGLTRAASLPQAPPEAVEGKPEAEAAAVEETPPLPDPKVLPEPSQPETVDTASVEADATPIPLEHVPCPSDSPLQGNTESKEPEKAKMLEEPIAAPPVDLPQEQAPVEDPPVDVLQEQGSVDAPPVDLPQEQAPVDAPPVDVLQEQAPIDAPPVDLPQEQAPVDAPPVDLPQEQAPVVNEGLEKASESSEAAPKTDEHQEEVVELVAEGEASSQAPPVGGKREEFVIEKVPDASVEVMEAEANIPQEIVTKDNSIIHETPLEPKPELIPPVVAEQQEKDSSAEGVTNEVKLNEPPIAEEPTCTPVAVAEQAKAAEPEKELEVEPQKADMVAPVQGQAEELLPQEIVSNVSTVPDQPAEPDTEVTTPVVTEKGGEDSGEKESGEKEAGEKESGEKESGEKEAGEKVSGEKQSGEKESGEKEAGEKVSGEKESGEKAGSTETAPADSPKVEEPPPTPLKVPEQERTVVPTEAKEPTASALKDETELSGAAEEKGNVTTEETKAEAETTTEVIDIQKEAPVPESLPVEPQPVESDQETQLVEPDSSCPPAGNSELADSKVDPSPSEQVEEKPSATPADSEPHEKLEKEKAVGTEQEEAVSASPASDPEGVSPEREAEKEEAKPAVAEDSISTVSATEEIVPDVEPREVDPGTQSPKCDSASPLAQDVTPTDVEKAELKTELNTESVANREENKTSSDTEVKLEPMADNTSVESSQLLGCGFNEKDKVKPEEQTQAVDAGLALAASNEPQTTEIVAEHKPTQSESEAEPKPDDVAKNKQETSAVDTQRTSSSGCDKEVLEVEQKVLSREGDSPQSLPVSETPSSVTDKQVESQPTVGREQELVSVHEVKTDNNEKDSIDKEWKGDNKSVENKVSEDDCKANSVPLDPTPVVEQTFPAPVASEQDAVRKVDKSFPELEEKIEPEVQREFSGVDAEDQAEAKEMLKEPGDKDLVAKESSPTSPSDLAKLESSVLPILEAQIKEPTQPKDESGKLTDSLKGRRKLEVLPISSESPSSEDDKELSEKKIAEAPKKKLLMPTDIRGDSLEDSSESVSKESPISGDDEDFIRKQIMEMSENEDASPSDEENLIRRKIRDQERKRNEDQQGDTKERSASGKARRLLKNSTISPDDDGEMKKISTSLDAAEETLKEEGSESKVDQPQTEEQEGGMGVRKFRTIELNTTSCPVRVPGIPGDDGELEMDNLTDSPDDRSRGEGSSSLHASSFTPGTSPTSLSSLDEDSDSSPSHIRSGEGKQHRKAKHRQPGQVLPTIEDSSEEEELREEEELLREQEKQKGSGKKSKKDKEEIRAQRRRERPKTPPSNLSPIEDASPTEELRQEAEMEEIRRSSCSDFSPSIESEPEGFEIKAEKIAAVQKVFTLPTSMSLYSPTDDKDKKDDSLKKLKTADEAYEEIMLKAKSPTADKVEMPPGKDSLYGGMLIEDYVYESLVDGSKSVQQEPEKISVPTSPRKLRSPDEVYEDMMQKRKEFMQLEQEFQQTQPVSERPKPTIVLQPADSSASASTSVSIGKDGKPLLDAEAAYEELMKKVLTPGTSPTQHPDLPPAEGAPGLEADKDVPRRALQPIPDLRVTQCSSGEEGSDEEFGAGKMQDEVKADVPEADQTTASATEDPIAVVCEVPPSNTSIQPQAIVAASEVEQRVDISQPEAIDLSGVKSVTPNVVPKPSAPVDSSISPLPTVPQYTPTVPSIVSTAPPIPPKPAVLRRGLSQEKADVPIPPPLPPPTLPKPTVYPRKPPVPLPPQAVSTPIRCEPAAVTTGQAGLARQPVEAANKPHVPPPVPPKPSSISASMGYSHRPGDGVKPPVAPKPTAGSQPTSPAHVSYPPRPTALPTGTPDTALNLSPSTERPGYASPKSPSSPRYASSLHDTYVVITLPSQPSSPVEGFTTQAPSSPGPASPSRNAQPQSQQHPQPPPPQTTRVPLAYTRITESIESQEICGPEKVVSSSCHVIEAISASAQPLVMPNLVSQVVTTEVQRTTVSVVHERATPPMPAPRATGVPISLEKPKPQPTHTTHSYQPGEVVDLRTMKADPESSMKGVDLSTGPDIRRQSVVPDMGARPTSAVQSSVVNLSAESSTVSIVTDSITIVTCAATIQRYDNTDVPQASSSMPLQLTKNKAFEPVCQIVYRPIDAQPSTSANTEIPINLSVGSVTGGGTFQPPPVTIAPTPTAACVANGLTSSTATVAGAVDLSTVKPFNTVVSVDPSAADVVTAVITEDDGKPVDLTAGRRAAVCCDVVYTLPFAGSCTTQQPTTPLPEDRFGYRDDHYQYDRASYGFRGFGGIKPSMSDTNLAEAGLFAYKSKNSYNFNGTTEGAVDLTSAKISDAGEAVDYSKKGAYSGMIIPPYSQARVTGSTGTLFGTSSVLRSSNGVVYSSVAAPIPSTYAITTQPGSIFSTTYNTLSGMHTSDTMPSLSDLQNQPLTRSHSFLSTLSITTADEQNNAPLNLEISKQGVSTAGSGIATAATSLALDSYTEASLEAIAASLEALSSPMVPGDGQYQMEREMLEMEKMKQQRLAEELEWERQEIQRFREQEQILVQKELEELQSMKQQILCQQEEERQAHLMMQKETYAQQQQQLEQIQRLQEQLRQQLEEQRFRKMYPGADPVGHGQQEAIILGPDGTELARKIMDSGVQTDEEDGTVEKAYTAGRKKKTVKKSVDSCVQTDDEDQEEWEVPARGRRSRPRTARGERGGQVDMSIQAHTEISIQTDTEGNVRMDTRMELSDSERTSPKRRPTPLEIGTSTQLKTDSVSLQAPPKSPKVLYSPISPCISPSKSLEFVSYEKSLDDTSPQRIRGTTEPGKVSPASPRSSKVIQRSLTDPKSMSPTGEERSSQFGDGYSGKGSSGSTPTGTQKKVKRTLPNPPSEDESTSTNQTGYSTGSARRRMCRNSNMARAKILQDIDRELNLVERESSKLRKKQAELDEEEKEIDAKLRYLEMGINRRKDVLLKEREKRERAYLQSVAEDRDYMSDSEVSNIRETRGGRGVSGVEEVGSHGLERPRTAPQSELEEFVPPQTTHEYSKYSQYQYSQSQTMYQQQSLYQAPQSYQSQSLYSSVPSLSSSQQQSYHQMLLLQQKAARQAALLSELDATKMASAYDVISHQPDPTSSSYLGVKYDKYGNHLDLRALEGVSMAGSPMSNVSDSYYTDLDHQTPRSYVLLEDAAELAKSSTSLASSSYSLAEKELAKAERLLRRSAADLGSTDYLGSTSRLHTYGKTPDEEDAMEEPYELKLLKQQLKQEFRRSGTESLEQLAGLPQHYYTPSSGVSSYSQRHYPKTEKYSISRLTLEKQAAKQLPASMLYQKHKTPQMEPKISTKYSSVQDSRGLETDYSSYLGSSGSSPRSSRLMQDEITFGLRKNIAEQQKYLGSTLGANLAGSLNLGQSMNLDSAYPSGSRSRPSSRPSSMYGLDLSIKRDPSSSSLRLKGDGEVSLEGSSYQAPSGRTKPTSLPIVQGGRGRIPIVAQNSEEESPLSPVGQPMGMARASAGPLPPISADSRDQFGSCLSLQEPQQQQHLREEPTRGRGYVMMDDLQGTMSDGEALSDSLMALNREDLRASHENMANAYHLRREEPDWFDQPLDEQLQNGHERRQVKDVYYPFPHTRVKLQRNPKDRSVSGNGLGIRVVGGKEVAGSNGDIGAYVAKVLPGGVAEQSGKILEGMQVLEWNGVALTGKTYEEVQGLVGQLCGEAELCVRLDLNMLADSDTSHHLDYQDQTKGDRPPRSPGVDPKQLAAELQKVSQQQAPPPTTTTSSSLSAGGGDRGGSASTTSSAVASPGQPGSPSVSKKRHSSKTAEAGKTQSHPVSGEIQLQMNYDKQMGNLIVHVLQARNLAPRDNNAYSDPFVKVYLLPGRGQIMVVQNASAENKRRSKHAGKSLNPEWNQTVIYKNIHLEQLRKKTLEVSVWDYEKSSSNDFLGEVLIDLSNTAQLDNIPRWLQLKDQSEGDHHRRSHTGQGRQHSPKQPPHGSQHASPKTGGSAQDSPKSSVIKSRSHGIFPDPAKDTQVPTIEKSHSSPGTSKPSQSENQHHHTRSHGATRSAGGKSASLPHHPKGGGSAGGGVAAATGEASAPQQQQQQQQHAPQRLQPTQRNSAHLSLRHHRHSVAGVVTVRRPQSDSLPALPPTAPSANWSRAAGRQLTLRKALSEERPWRDGARASHRSGDAPVTAASLDSGLSGSAYSLLDEDGETNAVDSAIFQIPRLGKIPNGTDGMKSPLGQGDSEGKTQVMGEIKIALKKEVRTEGDQLVLEILQCRNITYKFKSPDHLPDLYVKLYVVNIATQKRIIKKKTRVCRHDREPSFNETFRFCMNPTGHSLQLFLVSNGGKFVKKTLIGEAYVWLDKVDLRKRVVSWHKLLASSAQIHS